MAGRGGNRGGMHVPNQQELRMPPGWEACPPFGAPIPLVDQKKFNIIPSKVPLSFHYNRLLKDQKNAYTLTIALQQIQYSYGVQVGMVIDLTNSVRYYDFNSEVPDHERLEISYHKIPCRGKGQSPDPAAVNRAVYELYRFWEYFPERYVLMHCTHGFNRTGYIIVNAMVRLAAKYGMTVDRSLKRFATARTPGIYKDGYINDLYKYHHEGRDKLVITPPVPGWKGGSEGDDDDPDQAAEPAPAAPAEIRHDRIQDIGEEVFIEEQVWLKGLVFHLITGHDAPRGRDPHFCGSQPVSLARMNLELLQKKRYWVSWKADGTRYMLLILDRGCYLIDRSYKMVRLQMRFPTPAKPPGPPKPGEKCTWQPYPVDRPHNCTLLDGEMVVDVDKETGLAVRRYLVYDMPVLQSKPISQDPWLQRFKSMDKQVVMPRSRERAYTLKQIGTTSSRERFHTPALMYDYASEPFSVRKKDFWPLFYSSKVIKEMIPNLCHEADGLILQATDSEYVANTDNALLKYKFAACNSVDFRLTVERRGGKPEYHIAVMDTSQRRVFGQPPAMREVHTPVTFPEGVDGVALDGAIIECSWLPEQQCWHFMRIREDKDKPNAYYVYEKVKTSIQDDIKDDELLHYLDQVFWFRSEYQVDHTMVPPAYTGPRAPDLSPPASPRTLHQQAQQAARAPQAQDPIGRQELNGDVQQLPPPPPINPYIPRSPEYFGPVPTPPREQLQQGGIEAEQAPLDPSTWESYQPHHYPDYPRQQYMLQMGLLPHPEHDAAPPPDSQPAILPPPPADESDLDGQINPSYSDWPPPPHMGQPEAQAPSQGHHHHKGQQGQAGSQPHIQAGMHAQGQQEQQPHINAETHVHGQQAQPPDVSAEMHAQEQHELQGQGQQGQGQGPAPAGQSRGLDPKAPGHQGENGAAHSSNSVVGGAMMGGRQGAAGAKRGRAGADAEAELAKKAKTKIDYGLDEFDDL